jgi:hypothetical protein
MYLGNIVVSETLSGNTIPTNVGEVKVVDYNETTQPTLIVGWENTKALYPEVSILSKEIKENLYWTFSPHEKRGIFETDLKSFIEKINNDLYSNIEIVNIDPVLYNLESEGVLFTRLERFSDSFGYLYLNKFYFFYENKIYHIDLNLLEFIGFNLESVETFLNGNFKMIEGVEYDVDEKFIPYLYSKDAEQNNTISHIHKE